MERHPVGAGRGTCCVPGSHGRSAPRSVPFPRRAKARLAAHGIHAPFCAATAYAGGLRIGSAVPRSQTSRPAPQRGPDRTSHAVARRGRARETRRRTTSAPLPRTTCGVDFLTALSRLVEVVGPSGAHRHRLHREARHHTQRPRITEVGEYLQRTPSTTAPPGAHHGEDVSERSPTGGSTPGIGSNCSAGSSPCTTGFVPRRTNLAEPVHAPAICSTRRGGERRCTDTHQRVMEWPCHRGRPGSR